MPHGPCPMPDVVKKANGFLRDGFCLWSRNHDGGGDEEWPSKKLLRAREVRERRAASALAEKAVELFREPFGHSAFPMREDKLARLFREMRQEQFGVECGRRRCTFEERSALLAKVPNRMVIFFFFPRG